MTSLSNLTQHLLSVLSVAEGAGLDLKSKLDQLANAYGLSVPSRAARSPLEYAFTLLCYVRSHYSARFPFILSLLFFCDVTSSPGPSFIFGLFVPWRSSRGRTSPVAVGS